MDRRRRGPGSRLVISSSSQNKQLDDDAGRQIEETRQYLDDADELLRTQNTAVDFFNAKIERYPNHLGRTVLWMGTSTLYGVREHPEQDIRQDRRQLVAVRRPTGATPTPESQLCTTEPRRCSDTGDGLAS